MKWEKFGAAGDGDEAGIGGLGLAESFGDAVAPDARLFTALSSCDSSRIWLNLCGWEVVSVAFNLQLEFEEDKPDFA